MVALAVLGIAVLSLTALRTDSVVTAADARNQRVARSLAEQVLSEVQAGIHNVYDMRDIEHTWEGYPHFTYKVLVGESSVQDEETRLAEEQADSYDANDSDQRHYERQDWLNQRSRIQRARKAGLALDDLEDELEEDDEPDEDTFEEIAVYVYYPDVHTAGERTQFRVRARVTTLALSGLTNEQAAERSSNLSEASTGGSTNTGAGSTGSATGTGK